jgi:hypothetical protein
MRPAQNKRAKIVHLQQMARSASPQPQLPDHAAARESPLPRRRRWRQTLSRALVVWLLIVAAETPHGIARTVWLEPIVGDLPARQIGVFTGSGLVLAIAYLAAPWLRTRKEPKLLGIGLLWVGLTVIFEVALARWLGLSWGRPLSDYDPGRGGFMLFALAVMACAPLLASRMRLYR